MWFYGVPFAGITDEVEADTDVLGALMELWVLWKFDCTLANAMHSARPRIHRLHAQQIFLHPDY